MPETENLTTILLPGDQLRLKRLEHGLGVEDVAKELYLSQAQLLAIEANDYSSLPGPTYIVGYWRSYANLLDIDLGDAIEAHRKELKETSAGIVLEPNHQKAHGHQEKSRKKSAIVFLFLSLVFLAGIWFWQNPSNNPLNQWISNLGSIKVSSRIGDAPESIQEKIMDSDPSDQIVELVSQSEPIKLDDSSRVEPNFSDDFTPTEFEQIVRLGGDAAILDDGEIVDSNELPKVKNQSSDQVTRFSDEGQTEEVLNLLKEQDKLISEAADVSSPHRLVFKVKIQTWLDIRDQSGEKLVYGTVEEGQRVELKGDPPFSIFIGSSSGVELEYLGEPVIYTPHKSGLFSRFQVGSVQ